MDSMSSILKQLSNNPYAADAERKMQEVLQHKLVKELLIKYPSITEHDLKINMNRLYQYVQENERCRNCPGLSNCPNDFQGHYTRIAVEEINGQVQVIDYKTPCKKLRAEQSKKMLRERIRSFYMDEKTLDRGYSSSEILACDEERAAAVTQVMNYILQTKKEGLQTHGLYLAGDFGTGKTYLMGYLLHELAKADYHGVIVYMPDFIEDLKSMMHEPDKLKEMVELLKETDLLVFDDIGAESLNPWARDHVLGTILNHRMNRKPTFFTSNYDLDTLEKHLSFTNKDGEDDTKGRRLMERIRHYVDYVEVLGRNKRGRSRG